MIGKTRAFREVAQRSHRHLEAWLGADRANALAAFIGDRLDDGRPTIMVYGIYNAGKSTLLNALAGEERAPVSNRPETSVVTPYRWRDFEILDTPGIDAPQEHEEISRKQLDESDAIIFVLDSTSTFEESRVYAELTDILSAGKRTIVVVNNKSGAEKTDREGLMAQDKVLKNIQRECSTRGLPETLWRDMPLRMVDAGTALKGRLQGKQRLVEISGIEDLERDLDTVLGDAGIRDVVNTAAQRLLTALKDARDLTERTDDSEARRVAEKQTAVAASRTELENNVGNELRRLTRRFQNEFPHAARQEQSAVLRLHENAVEGVVVTLNSELQRAERIVAQQGIPFQAPSSEQMANEAAEADEWAGTRPDEWTEKTGNDRAGGFDPATAETLKRLGPNLTREASKHALHWAKRVVPSVMKGVGKVTIAKWASTLASSVPIIVAAWELGSAVRDIFASDPEEKAAIREEKRLVDIASDAAEELRVSLERWCRDIIDSAFGPVEAALHAEIEALREDEKGRASAHSALLNLTDEVERLC